MAKAKTISRSPLDRPPGGRSEWRPGDFQRDEVKCEPEDKDLPPPDPRASEDSVMMVLLPISTWREVEALGRRLGIMPQAVISRALQEFKDRMDKAT